MMLEEVSKHSDHGEPQVPSRVFRDDENDAGGDRQLLRLSYLVRGGTLSP